MDRPAHWQFLATPFFLAARNNHLHIIDLLLKFPDIEVDAVTEVRACLPGEPQSPSRRGRAASSLVH